MPDKEKVHLRTKMGIYTQNQRSWVRFLEFFTSIFTKKDKDGEIGEGNADTEEEVYVMENIQVGKYPGADGIYLMIVRETNKISEP